MVKKILVTGSNGLIGSEIVSFFANNGWDVYGADNNLRRFFFGPQGDTRWNQERLESKFSNFYHNELDIRDRHSVLSLINKLRPDAIIHAAAQPSHDKAASVPFDDFDTNAVGTLNLLEATRQYCKESPFVYLSTNKVYGDSPNNLQLQELDSRWEFTGNYYDYGISEVFNIDQSKHSLFGASKVAADIMVQEYGRYFDMPTCCLRGGCLTGPSHSGVELHGFLSYLIKCNLDKKLYTVFGYKAKQVRDIIHSYDVANFIYQFVENPRSAEVYNLGGGKENSISMMESFRLIESISGIPMNYEYSNKAREGDHIVYYSDLRKMKLHYPDWSITKDLDTIFEDIYIGYKNRLRPESCG